MIHTKPYLRFHAFALTHDDLPAFHAAYFVLTAIVVAMLNLGCFAMLIVAHMCLDIFKYRHRHRYTWFQTAYATVRESILDIALLLMGLSFAVYLHHSLPGIAALSGLALAEVTIVHAVALYGTKLKILSDVLGVFMHLEEYMAMKKPTLRTPFTILERISVGAITITFMLLALAATVLPLDAGAVLEIIVHEMTPGLI